MGLGKQKIKRAKATKLWKVLTGTYEKRMGRAEVERLIAVIQGDLMWDELDIKTMDAINKGKLDWSGDARGKRRTRKHIRKRR